MNAQGSVPFAMPIPEVSITIPCYNEEDNAQAIAAAVIAEVSKVTDSFDIIFIDNASTDRTVPLIRELCATDPRVRLIVNTRNFGQMRSPTHAIFQASGRAVIALCADFQDPPGLLPEFITRWRDGVDIVLGIRSTEKTSFILNRARAFAYWMGRTFGDYPIITNATGFGIYDRKVVDAISGLREPEPFFRGMLVETGYRLETITYHRPRRAGGFSKNNLASQLDFALSSLSGTSKRLLRAPFFVGVAAALLALICAIVTIVQLFAGSSAQLWLIATVVQAQLALFFLLLGLTSDQVRLISERTRQTPLVFECERVNFPKPE